jgi:hypothetical protein
MTFLFRGAPTELITSLAEVSPFNIFFQSITKFLINYYFLILFIAPDVLVVSLAALATFPKINSTYALASSWLMPSIALLLGTLVSILPVVLPLLELLLELLPLLRELGTLELH